MIKENQKYLNRILVLADFFIMLLSLIVAWYIRFKSGLINVAEGYLTFRQYLIPVVCLTPLFLLVYNIFDLYTPHRFKTMFQEFLNIIKANILGILMFILILFFFKEIDYSRYLIIIFT